MARTFGAYVLLNDVETFSAVGGCLLVDSLGRAFDIAALFDCADRETRQKCIVQRKFRYNEHTQRLVCVKEV